MLVSKRHLLLYAFCFAAMDSPCNIEYDKENCTPATPATDNVKKRSEITPASASDTKSRTDKHWGIVRSFCLEGSTGSELDDFKYEVSKDGCTWTMSCSATWNKSGTCQTTTWRYESSQSCSNFESLWLNPVCCLGVGTATGLSVRPLSGSACFCLVVWFSWSYLRMNTFTTSLWTGVYEYC
jgi:hypothetical protein